MRKSLLWALLLIMLCVIVFISTRGRVNVAFIRGIPTSIALLTFTGVGVVIGTLLK